MTEIFNVNNVLGVNDSLISIAAGSPSYFNNAIIAGVSIIYGFPGTGYAATQMNNNLVPTVIGAAATPVTVAGVFAPLQALYASTGATAITVAANTPVFTNGNSTLNVMVYYVVNVIQDPAQPAVSGDQIQVSILDSNNASQQVLSAVTTLPANTASQTATIVGQGIVTPLANTNTLTLQIQNITGARNILVTNAVVYVQRTFSA